jgi:hypothetical protein
MSGTGRNLSSRPRYLASNRLQDRSAHDIPSFAQYLNKVFGFRRAAGSLTDARRDPEFSAESVFLAVFHCFVFRRSSFRQFEADLADPHFQRHIGVERAFRDDTLRYSLCGFDLDPLERMLADVNRRLKRNKAFDQGRVQGRIVAALDGIEVLASYSRCCQACLERRVTAADGDGNPVERIQYYHRAVGCQIVSSAVKPLLAVEWLRPGEGEATAALRLLKRLPELYGSRFFDILLLDSLYPQAPVLELAARIGWDVVIAMKQQNRDLFQSAMRLFQSRPPDLRFCEQSAGRRADVQLWDTEGLPFTQDYPQPVRAVRSLEQVTQRHYRQRELTPETTTHEWFWVTTLPAAAFSVQQVWRLGHDRWKNENNGWNDLTQNWALKHGFLHACRHRPNAVSDSGQRQPVDNRGLAALMLILCLAFVLSSAFALLHSKIYRRYQPALIEIAQQLYRSLWRLQPPTRAPTQPPPMSS